MLRHVKIKFFLAALVICGTVLSSDSYAQGSASSGTLVEGVDCHAEEYVKALLDFAAIASQSAGGKSIGLIARPGSGETSRGLLHRRLQILRKYLVENRGIAKSKVTMTEGERVVGPGQVDVYVDGKPHILFRMKRNRGFADRGCYPY